MVQNEKDGDVEIVRQFGQQYLAILQEACHCKSPRLTEVALDIIHFFIGMILMCIALVSL